MKTIGLAGTPTSAHGHSKAASIQKKKPKKLNHAARRKLDWLKSLLKEKDEVFDGMYFVWRIIQHGQDKVERWEELQGRHPELRPQNGHEHACSILFLALHTLFGIRRHNHLQEWLTICGIIVHDLPEGITRVDKPAFQKVATDDLDEYIVFAELCKHLKRSEWRQLQRCYLLQYALVNPKCFPADARKVMSDIQRNNRDEALFFQGV